MDFYQNAKKWPGYIQEVTIGSESRHPMTVGGGVSIWEQLLGRSTQVAFLCALLFTFSYLFLREALLIMEPLAGLLK